MTNTKHTQGPWDLDADDNRDYEGLLQNVVIKAGCSIVLGACSCCEGVHMSEEDARLVVAAPDLYEALDNLENDAGQIPEHAWQMVQAALAKARGE